MSIKIGATTKRQISLRHPTAIAPLTGNAAAFKLVGEVLSDILDVRESGLVIIQDNLDAIRFQSQNIVGTMRGVEIHLNCALTAKPMAREELAAATIMVSELVFVRMLQNLT